MNFRDILNIADHNKAEARYEASQKRYSTSLPPPKKMAKANVQSNAVKQFLARKQAEEQQKAEEARQKREELLAIRAQNSKNNKKAKIMASRTKDNDFSRIKLTEDEVEAKKKREDELRTLALKDKVERMKARIIMEEKEKLLPKKRKRKSKHNGEEDGESHADYAHHDELREESKRPQAAMKKPALPPPSLNFHDLLKVAAKKQFEPVAIAKVKVDDDDARPLSKKAKRLLQEEENRVKRKLAAEAAANASKQKIHDVEKSLVNNVPTKIKIPKLPSAKTHTNQSTSRDPYVVHVQKDAKSEFAKQNPLKASKATGSLVKNGALNKSDRKISKSMPSSNSVKPSQSNSSSASFKNGITGNTAKPSGLTNVKSKPKENGVFKSENPNSSKASSSKTKPVAEVKKKVPLEEKKKPKVSPSSSSSKIINDEMLAEIERKVRAEIEKEMKAKLMETIASTVKASISATPQSKPKVEPRTNDQKTPVSNKPTPPLNNNKVVPSGKVLNGQKPPVKGPVGPPKANPVRTGQMLPPKKPPMKPPAPFAREKKPSFHPNPYIQPPRRLLESHRPMRPMKSRIESDDDDDDDDDDMNDFIDDGPQLMGDDENYSEYIKEIFGYDKSKYIDEDDDDVIESSYFQQMKEETISAKLGHAEDMEDIRKEREELARKKKKKKKLK